MEFRSLAILLTEDCNAQCKMCCDSRGLVCGKTLTETELISILENIKENNNINHVSITGGEPLLYPELIDVIFNFDFSRNVSISIKSNGFWGNDISYAETIIKKYHNKLSRISLSYDEFHKEFIDIQSIKNIINISKDYNIPSEVVACSLKNTLTPGDILNELGESAYLTKFYYQPVISTGSAKIFDEKDYIKLLDTNKDEIRCLSSIDPDILVNPKLTVYPCCSQVIENTILNLGNLKDETLNDIILNIKQNYIFSTIFTEGFTPFLNILKDQKIKYPRELASPCELCEFLFKDDWFLKLLTQVGYYEDL